MQTDNNRKVLAKKRKIKTSPGEKAFNVFNLILMTLISFLCVYPIWYVVVNSFNDAKDAMLGGIYFWPRIFSIENYKTVFETAGVFQSFFITIMRTLVGTISSVFFTAMVAYALSKQKLVGRKVYMAIGLITMFFNGGMIPTFLLFKGLHLLDSFWVFIIPALFSFYNLLIFNSFFGEIPAALEESAQIDGAGVFKIFLKIVLPLSKPVLATIALFNGVFHWNDYFAGVIYINNRNLEPIQTYLYRIIAEANSQQMLSSSVNITRNTTSSSIKLATMVITTIPIVCVYPFLQKYFVKGMMIGAVKE